MARVYSRKKGKHGSKKPPLKIVPKWVKLTKKEVESLVVGLAKEKKSSAVIGAILRDKYGLPSVQSLCGEGITEIMARHKLYPEYPEDLMSLFKQAVHLRAHLAKNKADRHSRTGLERMESKIRRLIKYYSRQGKISPDFAYDPEKVKLIIQK